MTQAIKQLVGHGTLIHSPIGADLQIMGYSNLPALHVKRLAELGLRLGSIVKVVTRGGFGGVVVACGRERLALDRQTAKAVKCRIPSAYSTECQGE